MTKFLSAQQLYRIFQRELPESVYPDGSPSGSFSTASAYSKAKVLESVYSNLNRIYDNQFPQTADERIDDWEIKVFGEVQNSMDTLEERRNKLLNKIRKQPTLTLWEILTIVVGYLPEGIFAQIVQWSCGQGGGSWMLGVSRLGVDTALGWGQFTLLQNPNNLDLCELVQGDGWRLGSSALGVDTKLGGLNSWQTISQVQKKAYTYEVRIFDYTLSAADYDRLVRDLKRFEPARSGRVIKQQQNLADYGLIFSAGDVDQFSGVNCITRDSTSSTGYTGRETANG